MTSSEWDICECPPDMVDALVQSGWASEAVRQLAVRVLGLGPNDHQPDVPTDGAGSQAEYDALNLENGRRWVYRELLTPGASQPEDNFRHARHAWDNRWIDPEVADLIRELVGNPFAPSVVQRGWLTSDVLALAHGIRSEKSFDRMPILSDALMDAGCDDEAVLAHCRYDGPHHDGCWVVALLLGGWPAEDG